MTAALKCAAGVSASDAGADSFAEAAARAALGLGGAAADVVVVFAGAPNLAHAEEGMAAVAERLHPAAAIGCGAQGVVGEAREVELGGVAVWAASLGEGVAEAFALEARQAEAGSLEIRGVPDLDRADALVLLVDPFSFPVEPLLATLADGHPGLPVIGGLASARGQGGTLLGRDGAIGAGAVGLALSGVRVAACVSQGARPIGPEMAITAGEGNVIEELAGKPAIARARAGGGRALACGARAGRAGAPHRARRRPEQAGLRARRLPRSRDPLGRLRSRARSRSASASASARPSGCRCATRARPTRI